METDKIRLIPKYIEKAVIDTFQVQLGGVAKIAHISMDMNAILKLNVAYDCLTTIALQSTQFVGQLSIAVPKATALSILERMIGEKADDLTIENADACGEILNIVYSSARKNINESGFDFQLAIPTTVVGQNLFPARANLSGYALFFSCDSEFGSFLVMLSLRQAAAA